MRIVVSSIPDEGLHREIELLIALEDNVAENIARVDIKIQKFDKIVLIDGFAEMSASLICSRCLKGFSYPLKVRFKDEYVPAPEITGEKEHELTNKELELGFYSNDELDIKELIKEQMLLAVPMKPLCESDCQGICPKCGKDLNDGLCECKGEEVDPRLIKLKEFKKRLKK